MNVISVFLMGLDAKKYPPFSTEWLKETYTRRGYAQPVTDADEAALYEHALNFFDQFIKEAAQRGLTLRHRLDAQSVAWAVHQERTSVGPIIEPPVEPTPDLNALAEDLLLSRRVPARNRNLPQREAPSHLPRPARHGQDLRRPRPGETYLAGSEGGVTLVQFHPSYAYEDFVQGFRPKESDSSQLRFALTDGPLVRAAKAGRRLIAGREALPHHRRNQPGQPGQRY